MDRRLAMSLILVCFSGCASSTRNTPQPGGPPRAALARSAPEPQAAPSPSSAPVAAIGTPSVSGEKKPDPIGSPKMAVIQRRELMTYFRRGAQEFIQTVQVRPAFRRGRFLGWRILGYQGPGPVHRGDIVMRVNGQGLERPEEFMTAWNGLPSRATLIIEMLRGAKPLVLRYQIVD